MIASSRPAYAGMIAANVLLGFSWLLPRVELLISPVSEAGLLDAWAIPISYFCAGLFVVFACSLVGLSWQSKVGKWGFISSLSVMVTMILIDNTALIAYTVEAAKTDQTLLHSFKVYWGMTEGVRWLVWFGICYGYLFKRT